FADGTVTSIEFISLIAGFSYNLTMAADSVAAGDTLTLRAHSLGASDAVTFDGSAGTGTGNFVFNTPPPHALLPPRPPDDPLRPGSGNDTVQGGGGDDAINMAGNFTASDTIDGGTGSDTLLLDGNYTGGNAVSFGATTATDVETITLGAGHAYTLTLDAA